MPFICIGPVCIPWTAVAPILIWALRPLWNRLPPHVQSAISTRADAVQAFMQRQLWDRIGWKAKPAKKKAEGEAAPLLGDGGAELRSQMGTVVGVHSDAEWAAALELTRQSDVVLAVDVVYGKEAAVWAALVQTLVALTDEGTLVLMAHGNGAAPGVHQMTGSFYELAAPHFEATCLAADAEHPGCQIHCLVRRSRKRPRE